jgi:hypothetical protein
MAAPVLRERLALPARAARAIKPDKAVLWCKAVKVRQRAELPALPRAA